MRHKVKFRIQLSSGQRQKFSVNVDDGTAFQLDTRFLGAEFDRGSSQVLCSLNVRDGELYVSEGSVGEISLNNHVGAEFTVRPGDFIQVGEYAVEFLEAPHQTKEFAQTQFIDIAEVIPQAAKKKAAPLAAAVAKVKVESPAPIEAKPLFEKSNVTLRKVTEQSAQIKATLEKTEFGLTKEQEALATEEFQPSGTFPVEHLHASAAEVEADEVKRSRPKTPETSEVVDVSGMTNAEIDFEFQVTGETHQEAEPEFSETGTGTGAIEADSVAAREAVSGDRTQMMSSRDADGLNFEQPIEKTTFSKLTKNKAEPKPKAAKKAARSYAPHSPQAQNVVTGLTLLFGSAVVSGIITNYTSSGPVFNFGTFGFATLFTLLSAVALSFGFSAASEFLGIAKDVKPYLRFFAYCLIGSIPWSFAYAVPGSLLTLATLFQLLVIAVAFIIKFKPRTFQFSLVGAGSTAAIAVIAMKLASNGVLPKVQIEPRSAEIPVAQMDAPAIPTAPLAQNAPQLVPTVPTVPAPGTPPSQIAAANVTANPTPLPANQRQIASQTIEPAVPVAPINPPRAERISDPLAEDEFFTAVKTGNVQVVKDLVAKRAVNPDFVRDGDRRTALMYAASYGRTNVIRYLLTRKIDLNAQDPNGTTALMWAAYKGQTKAVEILLQARADTKIRRDGGDRALDLAKKFKQHEIARMLEGYEENRGIASIPTAPAHSKSRKRH